jgi:anti-sigma B factor antagonist
MDSNKRDPLEIEVQQSENRTLVMIAGELDAATASYLYEALSDLELADARNVVLDLAKVTFMDSTGLSVIVTEHKRLNHVNGTLTIFSPPSSIRRCSK